MTFILGADEKHNDGFLRLIEMLESFGKKHPSIIVILRINVAGHCDEQGQFDEVTQSFLLDLIRFFSAFRYIQACEIPAGEANNPQVMFFSGRKLVNGVRRLRFEFGDFGIGVVFPNSKRYDTNSVTQITFDSENRRYMVQK